MADRPPTGYLEIIEAERKCDFQLYNVIGVITDYLKPAQSRGTDLTMKLQLWDTSCTKSPDLNSNGMVIRCFGKDTNSFPRIQDVGDIVIAHDIKTMSKGSQRFGISNKSSTWTVISGSSLLNSSDPQFVDVEVRNTPASKFTESSRPSIAELRYANSLVKTKDISTRHGPPKSTTLDMATSTTEHGGMPPPIRKKFRMIKDVVSPHQAGASQFVDLVGEVRRVYGAGGNPVEIQLTDYTEHPLLFDYAEPDSTSMQKSSWVGPWGKRVITINAWDHHGQHVIEKVRNNEIDLGTYLRLCNVHIKMDKLGSMMQGNMRGGNNSGTSITIHCAKDAEHISELKDLITRKRAYNVARKSKAIGFVQDQDEPTKKRHHEQEPADDGKHKQKKSKSAKKRQKQKKADALSTNQHVRCEAINIPLTSVTSILAGEFLDRQTPTGNPYRLPFQNVKYKSSVLVVDFFPDKLEDFATPYRVSEYEALSDYDSLDDEEASLDHATRKPHDVKWKWHFILMVQDSSVPKKSKQVSAEEEDYPTMMLQVTGTDGDYLLNEEACDLRNQPQELAKLREKLFVLWGDLEERKRAGEKAGLASSRPFECLVKEYGVLQPDTSQWERMFRILGTNIG